MIFGRRDGPPGDRFLVYRVAIFFLGAAVWVVGALAERSEITGAAIVILFLGLALGIVGRRGGSD